MKNIVVCSDGTGNSALKGRGTNVFKLFEAVDLQAHLESRELAPQVAFYDDGVGTERVVFLKLLGGAFGWGLSRNVRDLYTDVARVYEPGDRLFLFGFSRGAYTVRALAGFIARAGILNRAGVKDDAELQAMVRRAYRRYRRCYRTWLRKLFEGSREIALAEDSAGPDVPFWKPPIEFIGVWDTVDAVGFPIDEAADFWNAVVYRFKFPDTDLSDSVKFACHAVAMDDERGTFHPVMWNENGAAPDRINQVWFAGAHSNVGGGYPKQGMSLVSLNWMMEQAELHGLRFLPGVRQLYAELQNVNDHLYNPRSGLGAYYRYKPRAIAEICGRCNVRPRIHFSVIERIALGTEGYAPGTLPEEFDVVGAPSAGVANAISRDVAAWHGRNAPLLAQTRVFVRMKQFCHLALVLCSLLAVVSLLRRVGVARLAASVLKPGAQDDATSLSTLNLAADLVTGEPWLCAGLVMFSLLGFACSGQIERKYSQFWFGFRHKLRECVLGEEKGIGTSGTV